MQLDSFTVVVATSALLILQGGIFLFFWLRDRAAIWLLLWGLPFLVGGAALTLYLRGQWQTDLMSIAIGNALRLAAFAGLWQGVRLFHGRRPQVWAVALILCGWLGACLVPAFLDSLFMRVVVASFLTAICTGLTAWELWRERGDALPSRQPLVVVFASFTVIMVARFLFAAVAPFPMGAAPLDPTWLAVFALVVFGLAEFAAVLFFSMTRERREAEQRTFALSDPLTGLLNRRAFAEFSARMARRRAGTPGPLALLVLDLDHFKHVNDHFGHEVGDRMLKAFAEIAEASVRQSDELFRMGGEEFCFVLPDTVLRDAIEVAERIRKGFEAIVLDCAGDPVGATVSIGIVATPTALDLDVLFAAADAAVYEAKARGRNRIVVAEPATLLRARGERPTRLSA